MRRLSWNLGASTSWNPLGLSRPIQGLLLYYVGVLLEQLTGLQLVKKFPAFHGTRRLITALTSVRHLSLSWASPRLLSKVLKFASQHTLYEPLSVDTRSAIRLTTSNSCIRLFISAHKLSTPTVFDGNSKELELRSDFMLLPRFIPAVRRRLNVGEALVSCTCRNIHSYMNFVVTQTIKSCHIKAGMESIFDVQDNTKMSQITTLNSEKHKAQGSKCYKMHCFRNF